MPTMYRILIGCALITTVALVSDRSTTMAGILGTAPINIPIVLWIIWSKNDSSYTDVELTSRSMLLGITSTACFIAVCWYGFSRRWSFALTMGAGYLLWAAVAFGPGLLAKLIGRS
jgi:type IV secretory pathway VirB6-like protein